MLYWLSYLSMSKALISWILTNYSFPCIHQLQFLQLPYKVRFTFITIRSSLYMRKLSHKKLVIKQVILGHSTSNLEGWDLNSSRLGWVTLECVITLPLEGQPLLPPISIPCTLDLTIDKGRVLSLLKRFKSSHTCLNIINLGDQWLCFISSVMENPYAKCLAETLAHVCNCQLLSLWHAWHCAKCFAMYMWMSWILKPWFPSLTC